MAADEYGWLKSSTEYTGFDDGDDDWFNTTDKSVFPVKGGSSEVRRLLAISTTLYEWDAGDAASLGKNAGTDRARGKATMPRAAGARAAARELDRLTQRAVLRAQVFPTARLRFATLAAFLAVRRA